LFAPTLPRSSAILVGMARRVRCPVLVGRDAPLSLLLGALEEAVAGSGDVVLVEGEAGIGKTRLVQELCERARERGARVLEGSCWPFLETVPYAPLLGILEGLGSPVRSWPSTTDIGRPSITDPTERTRIFQHVAEGIAELARSLPTVILVEDMHWSDAATGDLLLFLARRLRSASVLLVLTARTDEPAGPAPVVSTALAELARAGWVRRIRLQPLDERRTVELVTGILGSSPSADIIRQIADRAEGNPFLIEELIATGVSGDVPESGCIRQDSSFVGNSS
jgi:predicted ATPase